MRMAAYFSEPVFYQGSAIQKIMLYQKPAGETSVFLYAAKSAQICCADEWYPTLQDARAVWDARPHSEWVLIDDPLPGCQEDAADPVRVRGRAEGKPEWGKFEILRGGVWRPYEE